MTNEDDEDKEKLETLRTAADDIHGATSSLDAEINEQRAEIEQATARLNSRQTIRQEQKEQVLKLADQIAQNEVQIEEDKTILQLSQKEMAEKKEAAEEAASVMVVNKKKLAQLAKARESAITEEVEQIMTQKSPLIDAAVADDIPVLESNQALTLPPTESAIAGEPPLPPPLQTPSQTEEVSNCWRGHKSGQG